MKHKEALLITTLLILLLASCACPCSNVMKATRSQHQVVRHNSRSFAGYEYRMFVESGKSKDEACELSFESLKHRLSETTISGLHKAERSSWPRVLYKFDNQ